MKVTCEYCGCYVDVDENTTCPNCLAELGSSIKAEKERVDEEQEAEREREAEEKAQEAKDDHISEIIQGVSNVAAAFVASKTAQNTQVVAQPAPPKHEEPERKRGLLETLFGSGDDAKDDPEKPMKHPRPDGNRHGGNPGDARNRAMRNTPTGKRVSMDAHRGPGSGAGGPGGHGGPGAGRR